MGPTTETYVWRGLVYSLYAGSALLAGLFMSPAPWNGALGFFAITFFLSAIFFSISYAISFHPEFPEGDDPQQLSSQTTALRFGFALLLSWCGNIITIYRVVYDIWPSWSLFLVLTAHILLFVSFARHLRTQVRRGVQSRIRHRLLWPSLLTIAINLYIGLHLDDFASSIVPAWPLAILVGYLLLSEAKRFSKAVLLKSSGGLIALLTVPVAAQQFPLLRPYSTQIGNLADALAAVVIASYLAVFESWRIASQVCIHEFGPVTSASDSLATDHPDTETDKHYIASLVGLIVAGLLIPFYYVFSPSGTIFIVAVALHGMFVFYYWTQRGATIAQLSAPHWHYKQYAAGIVLLLIIAADAKWSFQPRGHVLAERLVEVMLGGIALAIAFSPLRSLRKDPYFKKFIRRDFSFENFRHLFRLRMNSIRMMGMGAYALAVALFFYQQQKTLTQTDPTVVGKIDFAFAIYFLYIGIAGYVELQWAYGDRRTHYLYHRVGASVTKETPE